MNDTIPARFLQTLRTRPDAVALRRTVNGETETITFSEYAARAARVAAGLRALGVGHGDRVVLLIGNRPEFHAADLAALLLGATPISIYNSSSPDQIRYLVGHARATLAIVEDADYLERILAVRDELPDLGAVVLIDGDRRPRPAPGAGSSAGPGCSSPNRSISKRRRRSPSPTTSRPSSTRRAPRGRPRA